MNTIFLDKICNQIISETDIDYDKEEVNVPFHPFKLFTAPFTLHVFIFIIITSFSDHCKEVYGLNEEESEYVWKKYKEIIKDKINNGL